MDGIRKDNRFVHIAKDPRFRRMKHSERKVKIDKRFKGMFNEKKFKLKYMVDKRGRPVRTSTKEDLKKYYEQSSDSGSEDSDAESGEQEIERPTGKATSQSKGNCTSNYKATVT